MKRAGIVITLLALYLQFACIQTCLGASPAARPKYAHSLSVLNMAIGYLDEFTPSRELNERLITAITSIDAAAKEISMYAVGEEKYIEFRPMIDAGMKKPERYQKALELLELIRDDIGGTKDEIYASGLQARVMVHLNKAVKDVKNILSKSNYGGRHPGYLSALSSLHIARGYLNKITPNLRLDNNELNAIGEINGALSDIKTAAIIGGLDITDYSMPGPGLPEADRYSRALELLNEAFTAVNMEEENAFAKGSQKLALRHINNAAGIVKRIVR